MAHRKGCPLITGWSGFDSQKDHQKGGERKMVSFVAWLDMVCSLLLAAFFSASHQEEDLEPKPYHPGHVYGPYGYTSGFK